MNATSRTNTLTAVAPLRPTRLWWCRLVLPLLRILATSSALARLRSIHFGGWIVVGDLPGLTRPGWRNRPSMIFVSNYAGDLTEYLAAFGIEAVPGMRWTFGSTDGFPGTRPTRRFIDYVEAHRAVDLLQYAAYPDRTVRDVDVALEVSQRIGDLRRVADGTGRSGEARFAEAYRGLLDALALAPEPAVPSFWSALWRAVRNRSTVHGVVAVMPVEPGRTGELRAAIAGLAAGTPSVFDRVPGLHFARLAIIRAEGRRRSPAPAPDFLLFAAWADGDGGALVRRLAGTLGAPAADAIWRCCSGYPGAGDHQALAAWIAEHRLPISLAVCCREGVSVDRIRDALARHDHALDVVTAEQGRSLRELRHELESLWS